MQENVENPSLSLHTVNRHQMQARSQNIVTRKNFQWPPESSLRSCYSPYTLTCARLSALVQYLSPFRSFKPLHEDPSKSIEAGNSSS